MWLSHHDHLQAWSPTNSCVFYTQRTTMSTTIFTLRLRATITSFRWTYVHDILSFSPKNHYDTLHKLCRRRLSFETFNKARFPHVCSERYITNVNKRWKSKSSNTKKIPDDDDSDGSDTDGDLTDNDSDSDDDETEFPPETDPSLPPQYQDRIVHVVRADKIVGECLTKTKSAAVQLFYEGKLRLNNSTLLKKASKVKENDLLDVVHKEEDDRLQLSRVKVLKVYNERSKAGKQRVAVRVWKKQFYIDKSNIR